MSVQNLSQSSAPQIADIIKCINESIAEGIYFIIWDPFLDIETKKALRDNGFKIKGEFWGGDIRIEW